MTMKKNILLFIATFTMLSLNAQHAVRYVVLKNNQWIDIFHSVVDIFIIGEDTCYHLQGNTGAFVANTKDKKSLITVPTNDIIIVGVKITHLYKDKKEYYTGCFEGKELADIALIEINLESSKNKNDLTCQLFKQSDHINTVRQQVFFSIDGEICHNIDSILLCDNTDTFSLLYDYGTLYFDSLLLNSICKHSSDKVLNILLFASRKCYNIPYHNSDNNTWYVFVRNVGRKKYTTGWYDDYCLFTKTRLKHSGRRGAFH